MSGLYKLHFHVVYQAITIIDSFRIPVTAQLKFVSGNDPLDQDI